MNRASSTPRSRRRRRLEQEFQISLVELLNVALTPETRFFHVPNGGFRTRAEAGILKAMGVQPGMMDLIFLRRVVIDGTAVCCAYGLELKTDDGALSADQLGMHAHLSTLAMPIAVARTIDEAIEHLRAWSIPLRIKDETRGAAA